METCQALQAVALFWMGLITSGRTLNSCQFSAIWQRFGDFTGWSSFICICSLSSVPLISNFMCDVGLLKPKKGTDKQSFSSPREGGREKRCFIYKHWHQAVAYQCHVLQNYRANISTWPVPLHKKSIILHNF